MADLTLVQRFGSNVTFNATSGTLTITLSDLADQADGGDMTSGLGLDTTAMNDSNKDEYSSRIIWALLQLNLQNQPENNNDETIGIYVTNEGRRNVTRNSVAQLGFRLTATAHIADTQGVTLDPDDI